MGKYAIIYIYITYIYIYICIYVYIIYIYIFKQISTFNVLKHKKHMIYLKAQILSSFQKLYQCEIKLQTKMQITQQHNKSKLKILTEQNKRNNCQGKNIIMSTQKKIVSRLN